MTLAPPHLTRPLTLGALSSKPNGVYPEPCPPRQTPFRYTCAARCELSASRMSSRLRARDQESAGSMLTGRTVDAVCAPSKSRRTCCPCALAGIVSVLR